MAALGDKNHLAGAGSDGAGLGVHGEAALDDIVNLVIRQMPGEGGLFHDHQPRPQAGALGQGQEIMGPDPVLRVAGVQPVLLRHLDLGQIHLEHLGTAQLLQQNGPDGLLKIGSRHVVSLL